RRQHDHGHAALENAEFAGGGAGEVDDAPTCARPVVDGDHDIAAAADQRYTDTGADRQAGMGGGERVLVVGAAAAGTLAVPALASIPGGEAGLVAALHGRTVVQEGGGAGDGEARSDVSGRRMDGSGTAQARDLGGV